MQAFHGPISPFQNSGQLSSEERDDDLSAGEANNIMQQPMTKKDPALNTEYRSFTNPQYTPLLYGSNYFSALSSLRDDKARERMRLENENLLKQYYSSKKSTTHAVYRHGSVTSCGESTTSNGGSISGVSGGTYNRSSHTWLNKFLDNGDDLADSFDFQMALNPPNASNTGEEAEKRHIMETSAVRTYYDHFQKLLTVDIREPDLLRKHNMWMPSIQSQFRPFVLMEELDRNRPYNNKVSPLFLEGSKYIPREYDTYGGCTIFPSYFSEYKLPSFCYHSGVEVNGQIFILGGLVACHKYDEEAPSLKDFEVDGVKNLPPPLLPKIINNPSMINNSRLYVISISSCRISRPEISGTIPPPLLCMKGSKLTERHIFYYGGFEIKTETTSDARGVLFLKKRAFVNNSAYVLDTMTFKFSKIELTALPYKYVTYPTLAARFGHMQISAMSNNWCSNHGQKSYDCCDNGNMTSSENDVTPSEATSVSESPSTSANSANRSSNNHSSGVYTIIIFGGYRQTGDDKYEAMNDMWKVEVPVIARGKRGHFKFGDTASASIISKSKESDQWPSRRAFSGSSLEDSGLLNKSMAQSNILKNLEENFNIESRSQPTNLKSKPLFPNIPHARRDTPLSKHSSSSKDFSVGSSSSVKQRLNAGTSTSTFTLQQAMNKKQVYDGKLIVIYGGSNKNDVCGDMWWFDLDTETWTNVTTFAKSKKNGLVPITVGLVGHSMISVGHICVCLGGLTQADVNELYPVGGYSKHDKDTELNVGNDFLNIFDLTTQCLQGHIVDPQFENGEINRVHISETEPYTTSLIMSFGCTVLHFNGWIILVGGLVAKRSNIGDIYMRGAILECVLPSGNLAS